MKFHFHLLGSVETNQRLGALERNMPSVVDDFLGEWMERWAATLRSKLLGQEFPHEDINKRWAKQKGRNEILLWEDSYANSIEVRRLGALMYDITPSSDELSTGSKRKSREISMLDLAFILENGTTSGGVEIPARPHFQPTFDEMVEDLKDVEEELVRRFGRIGI